MAAAKLGALALLFAILPDRICANESAYQTNCNNTLTDHLDAFGRCDVEKIMAGYSTNAILIAGGDTANGTDAIRNLFANFFTSLCPQRVPGTVSMRQPPRTTCTNNSGATTVCVSYIFYSMRSDDLSIPLATDTFTYDTQARIVLQTFTGPSVPVLAPGSDAYNTRSLSRHQEVGIALGVFAIFAVAGFVVLKPCRHKCCHRK